MRAVPSRGRGLRCDRVLHDATLAAMTTSAGLIVFRERDGTLEVMLAHMGGPFWARKDEGAWSIPKGEYVAPEEPYVAARREFAEELGAQAPRGSTHDLGELRKSSGKRVW